eukprot:TRINITY_DN8493_c0_g1_i4.p1 TRINITY_DN8493_c0_g1~~TRINITY_DN8493_c0_g1_i4.p1  ORF type:complete len:1105 (-),score=250.00 TRINITY_DN8493_c0_g1_i4:121-3393(-)
MCIRDRCKGALDVFEVPPERGFSCDVCEDSIPAGCVSRQCRGCDFDVCEGCFAAGVYCMPHQVKISLQVRDAPTGTAVDTSMYVASPQLEECTLRMRAQVRTGGRLVVFLSSPFGGMEGERVEFVEKFVPMLREQCEHKGVTLVVVDLRWGITAEQAHQSLTLRLCLESIDDTHIFVGFYGARYGTCFRPTSWFEQTKWVSEAFDAAKDAFPFVDEWRDRGITELEFRHGCLNDNSTRLSAVYFREDSFDSSQIRDHPETAWKYTNPVPEEQVLLAQLRDEVWSRADEFYAVRGYESPAMGAALMYRDVRAMIGELLPTTPVDWYEEENLAHSAFESCRTAALVDPQNDIQTRIEQALAPGCLVALVGAPGSGKTSTVIQFFQQTDRLLVKHFVGASTRSAHAPSLVHRLVKEMGVSQANTLDFEGNLELLPRVLTAVSDNLEGAGGKLVIVIDGLEGLENDSFMFLSKAYHNAHELLWLPQELPPNISILVTTEEGSACHRALQQRAATIINTEPLTPTVRGQISEYLCKITYKQLTPEQQARLFSNPATSDPLFLVLAVSELLQFGPFEHLDQLIDTLAGLDSVERLLKHILLRLDSQFHGTAKKLLGLVASSKRGLDETALQKLLGMDSAEDFEEFITLRSALLRSVLTEVRGAYVLRSSQVRTVVLDWCAEDHHLRLVEYFCTLPYITRNEQDGTLEYKRQVVTELPYHVQQLGAEEASKGIKSSLIDNAFATSWAFLERTFDQFVSQASRIELYRAIYLASTKFDKYDASTMFSIRHTLAHELRTASKFDEAAQLMIENVQTASEDRRALSMSELGMLSRDQGNLPKAANLIEQAIVFEEQSLQSLRDGEESSRNEADMEGTLAVCHNNLSMVRHEQGQVEVALQQRQKALKIKEKYMDARDSSLGLAHMNIGASQEKLGLLTEAVVSTEHAERIMLNAVGPKHALYAMVRMNRASLLMQQGQKAESVAMFEEVLDLYRELLGPRHLDVAAALNNVAWAYNQCGQTESVVRTHREALTIKLETYGTDNHLNVALSLSNLGGALYAAGEKGEAKELFQREIDVYIAQHIQEEDERYETALHNLHAC